MRSAPADMIQLYVSYWRVRRIAAKCSAGASCRVQQCCYKHSRRSNKKEGGIDFRIKNAPGRSRVWTVGGKLQPLSKRKRFNKPSETNWYFRRNCFKQIPCYRSRILLPCFAGLVVFTLVNELLLKIPVVLNA